MKHRYLNHFLTPHSFGFATFVEQAIVVLDFVLYVTTMCTDWAFVVYSPLDNDNTVVLECFYTISPEFVWSDKAKLPLVLLSVLTHSQDLTPQLLPKRRDMNRQQWDCRASLFFQSF